MLIAMTVTCLFLTAAIATGLSLIDTWLRAKDSYQSLKREQHALKVGFTRQAEAHEARLRQPRRRSVRRYPAPGRSTAFAGKRRVIRVLG